MSPDELLAEAERLLNPLGIPTAPARWEQRQAQALTALAHARLIARSVELGEEAMAITRALARKTIDHEGGTA
jgi:hypothetical protein